MQNEIAKFRRLKELREAEPENLIDVRETNWTILPPGEGEPYDGTGTTGPREHPPVIVNMDRIRWLQQIGRLWGHDPYIAIANLDKTGDYDYRVVILPQVIGGQLVEHAIAENPSSDNATFVFRAEQGIDDAGNVWLTWKDVFDGKKDHAKALGARRILHTAYHEDNVIEYLTRPVEKLDSKRYYR